jgi:nucleoid-associated protein YgaU
MMTLRIDPEAANAKKTCKSPRQKLEWLLALMIMALVAVVVITRIIAPIVVGEHVSSEVYVVSRGDTLVSIAERVDPNANPYPIVAQMEVQTHGTVLWPGERIIVPTARH